MPVRHTNQAGACRREAGLHALPWALTCDTTGISTPRPQRRRCAPQEPNSREKSTEVAEGRRERALPLSARCARGALNALRHFRGPGGIDSDDAQMSRQKRRESVGRTFSRFEKADLQRSESVGGP